MRFSTLVKRVEGLHAISRRAFCGGFAGCVGLVVAGCTDGGLGIVGTGPLNGPDGSHDHPDAGSGAKHDGGTQVDAPNLATCPSSGATDVGAPASFALNTPVYHSAGNFFVMRDSGGLYALTARCTHNGVTVVDNSGQFFCPAHGATFTYNGVVTNGPAFTPLVHYAMCTLAGGHVGVITSQTVAASQRLVA